MYAGAKNYEFLWKYFFVTRKKRGCGFLHSKPLPSPLSSDDAIEIGLSDWLVNQDYVICKQTRDSIVTKTAHVLSNSLYSNFHFLVLISCLDHSATCEKKYHKSYVRTTSLVHVNCNINLLVAGRFQNLHGLTRNEINPICQKKAFQSFILRSINL